MEFATIAIAVTGVVAATHVYEWARLRRITPEERQAYKEKIRLRKAAEKRLASIEAARKKREEREKAEEEERKKLAVKQHRDADTQSTPFTYRIGRHANEALAIRYGIANQKQETTKGYYYAKGGERKRAPSRDRTRYVPAGTMRLKKLEKIEANTYRAVLTNYRDREVIAVIEPGTDYIKTFLPKDDAWFVKHQKLEEVLKGNGSFSLKELARFHIEKAVD